MSRSNGFRNSHTRVDVHLSKSDLKMTPASRTKAGNSRNKYYNNGDAGDLTQIMERESQEGIGGFLSPDENISNSSEFQLIDRFDDRIDP